MKIDTIKSGGQSQGGLDNAGGTLSGPLLLSRDPQVPMEAATKRYVDTALSNLSASNVVSGTLPIARLPAFSGDITSEAGSNNMVLSNTGIALGEYGKIVVDAKGRATNGTGLGNSDIPNFDFSKITTDKPTTLAGYGITDCVSLTGGAMTGALILSGNPASGDNLVPKQYIDGMVNSLSASKTGDVIRKAYATTPAGFLKCNGAEVSKTTYADLYAVIGESNNSYNVIGSGQPWRQQYEINSLQSVDIGSWTAETTLPSNLYASSIIVTKNRVYLLGGFSAGAHVNTVRTAIINSNGTLGPWTTGTALPGVLSLSHVFVTKNRVYLCGGRNNLINFVSTVYTAPINSDGTLGTWTTDTALPGNLGLSQSIVTKNRVYLLGGQNEVSVISTVYTAPINSDGTLGTWTTDTALPGPLCFSQAVVTKNRVYLLGGNNGAASVSTVYTAPINTDGTLGTWTTGTSLPNAIQTSHSIVTKNRVYLLGGRNGDSYVSTVYTAPINVDGTLGAWTTNTALPINIAWGSVAIVKNYLYIIGGQNQSVDLSTVYSTPISGGLNDYSEYYTSDINNYMMPGSGRPWEQQYEINTTQNGDITGWTAGTNLPGNIAVNQVIVTKNRVYLLGGYNGTGPTSVVYTAPINSDGSLGTWTTTTSLPATVYSSQVILHKNYVYLLGGATSSTTVTSAVYYAQINADGTLGTWNTSPSSLPVGLSNSTAFITKNRIYLCGGCTNPVTLVWTGAVYTCLINTDGTLGTWTTASSLPGILPDSSVAITKNRVYLLGGYNGSAYVATVYTATINSDGMIGNWSVDTSLPIPIGWSQVVVVNKNVYLLGGYTTSSHINNVYRASILDNGTIGPWVNGTTLPISVTQHQVFVTKNKIYLLGGNITGGIAVSSVYSASISEGLNDYSPYYDGSVIPTEPINPTTTFKLPDMSATDVNGIYHYIKF